MTDLIWKINMDFIRYLSELEFNFFDESLDVHVILDLETNKFIMCSKSVKDMYEYTKEEFLNITPYDLSVEFVNQSQMESKQESILEKGYDKFITKHKTKKGKIIDVYVKSKRIDIKNTHILFIALINLGQEKQLNEYFKNKIKSEQTSLQTIQKIYKWNKYTKTLLKNDIVINLSNNEKNLLSILINNINSTVTKELLFETLDNKTTYNSLLAMVKRIRKKTSSDFIKNIYSGGYQITH